MAHGALDNCTNANIEGGVHPSSEDDNRVCYCETRFQREQLFMNFNSPTRNRAKLVSEATVAKWSAA